MSDPICEPGTVFCEAVDAIRRGDANLSSAAEHLVKQLTDAEMLWLLDGDLSMSQAWRDMVKRYNGIPYVAGAVARLGIPGIRFADGPRGIVCGTSTAFPVSLARAASWDPELEQSIGDAIGAEARVHGANLFGGVCINLAPFPGWGRMQESYGEDPVLLGAMGAALVKGVNPWVLSCVKHFAMNSMEEARFSVDVRAPEDVMHEVYFPHFRVAVEAGADSVMSAYNSVNGTWAGDSPYLLTEVLRGRWGFRGFVMTDFAFGMRDPVGSISAGQELEMPLRQQRAKALPGALQDGTLPREAVERAAVRLISSQLALALRARPDPARDVVASREHRALARTAATLGAVLLRNQPVDGAPLLPLNAAAMRRVAVLGKLADQANLGDVGSSQVFPPSTCSILEGLREALGDRVVHVTSNDTRETAEAARTADVAIVVVGLSAVDEGEAMMGVDDATVQLLGGWTNWRPFRKCLVALMGYVSRKKKMGGDRRDLRLHYEDVALIKCVSAANRRTVVIVIGGGTVVLDPWDSLVPAVLMGWYPGMEGGRALADILLGASEPGGRLPLVIPFSAGDLPKVDWRAKRVTYGRWWGQRMLDRDGVQAAYPFGFGLGYTTFAIREIKLGPIDGERFTVSAAVSNTGALNGRHVVQIYGIVPGEKGRPVRVLLGFSAVQIARGATTSVSVPCSTRPLQRWDGDRFVAGISPVFIEAAAYSGDPRAVSAELVIVQDQIGCPCLD